MKYEFMKYKKERLREKLFKLVYTRRSGQSLAEYGLILTLIAVVCIVGLTQLGVDIEKLLTDAINKITSVL